VQQPASTPGDEQGWQSAGTDSEPPHGVLARTLLRRAADHDDERACLDVIRALVRRIVFPDIRAHHFDDLVQDLFVALWNAKLRNLTETAIMAWLRVATIRLAGKYRRVRLRTATDEFTDTLSQVDSPGDGDIDFPKYRDHEGDFRTLVGGESQGDRALFALRLLGVSFIALSRDLDCSAGTLRARQSRMKGRLCNRLDPGLSAWIHGTDHTILCRVLLDVEVSASRAHVSLDRRLQHQAMSMLRASLPRDQPKTA
jgi:DNA-directed RNA polymerase specialized sigma24 family protein